jgi:hypothetical protein
VESRFVFCSLRGKYSFSVGLYFALFVPGEKPNFLGALGAILSLVAGIAGLKIARGSGHFPPEKINHGPKKNGRTTP